MATGYRLKTVSQQILLLVALVLVVKHMYYCQQTLCRQKGKGKMITNAELYEFEQSIFTGVTVGVGSLVLLFSSGARVTIQCPFQCGEKDHLHTGHGENLSTSNFLFPLLNHVVRKCSVIDGEILKLSFDNEIHIQVFPENNGFESYVITTSHGDYPVITY